MASRNQMKKRFGQHKEILVVAGQLITLSVGTRFSLHCKALIHSLTLQSPACCIHNNDLQSDILSLEAKLKKIEKILPENYRPAALMCANAN